MATDLNITMKQYNGVDYDTLYPKTTIEQIDGLSNSYFTKNQILTSLTANQFGLGSNAVPDDVLSFLGQYNEYWWKRIAADTTEYVHSTNRNAYPDSGTQDGYTYTYLDVPFENAVTTPKIETGSYVGTGVADTTIPLSFTPKFVFVMQRINDAPGVGLVTTDAVTYITSNSCGWNETTYIAGARITTNGFIVGVRYTSWFNESGKTGYYFAIG